MFGFPPERVDRRQRVEKARGITPLAAALDHDGHQIISGDADRSTLGFMGKQASDRRDRPPDGNDALVGDQAVIEVENLGGIIEWMKAHHPPARTVAHCQGQLDSVAPL